MRKLLISLLCGTLLVLGACAPTIPISEEPTNPSTPEELPREIVVEETETQTLITDVVGFPEVEEGYGLWGATVTVKNVYPGWSGSAPVTIVNGKDQRRTFHLMVQQPGSTIKEGYEPFPTKYFNWITIEDLNPEVAIGGVKKVSVTLSAPYTFPSEMRGKDYEVRILVEDWSQTGFIQLALQAKWLITFAE